MKSLIGAVVLVLALSGSVHAANVFYSGNELYKFLTSQNNDEKIKGYAYLTGVFDSMALHKRVKTTNKITAEQLRSIMLKFLEAHPERRHQSAVELADEVFSKAFLLTN